MSEKIRVGIVGIGNMGTSHLRNYKEGKMPEVEISAVCDIKAERLEWAEKEFPEIPRFEAYDAMLESGLCDAVLIAVPHYDHPPMAIKALEKGLLSPKVLGVDIQTLRYQVPGGMLSNLVSQLKDAHAEDKYEEVLNEIPRVRADFGEPPLVTPSSQIVGTQAVLNVLMGERYKMITKESRALLHGEYGQTVKPFNPEVQKKACGDDEPITCRPADLIKPQLKEIEAKMSQWKQQDEDVLSYALFPQVAEEFFKYREAQQTKIDPSAADTANGVYPV